MVATIRILYVDDEPNLLELGKLFLEEGGEFLVETVTSAKEALTQWDPTRYHAIISDYMMPEMDGIAFLKHLRSHGEQVPFILFTGRGREEIVMEALNSGADFYLQKGGDPDSQFAELAHKVRQAVERKRIADELSESRQRMTDIIDHLPDATFAIDLEGKVIAWNRAMEEMTTVKKEEILGKGDHAYSLPFYGIRRPILLDLILKDDPETGKKYPHIIRKDKNLISEIYIPILYGGKGAFVWFIASPLYDTHGNIVGAIESIRDITDRKKAEEALVQSERFRKDLIDFLPDATFAIDLNGRIIVWNKATEEMTGITAADILGKGDYEYSIPFYGVRRPILIDLVLADDKEIQMKYRHIQRSGNVVFGETFTPTLHDGKGAYLLGISSPLYDANGNITGAIESIRDITDKREAELALEESRQRMTDIIDHLPDATFAIDLEGKVIAWNRAMEEMTTVKKEEILGKGDHAYSLPFYGIRRPILLDLILKDDPETGKKYPHITRKDKNLISEIYIPILYGGKGAFVWFIASPLFDTHGNIVGAIESIRDITDRKKAEEALQNRPRPQTIPDNQ